MPRYQTWTAVVVSTTLWLAPALAKGASAEDAWQGTPAGAALQKWIAVYNKNEQAAFAAFALKSFTDAELAERSPADIARGARNWFLNYGTFVLRTAEAKSTTDAEAIVYTAGVDACARLFVELEKTAPYRISAVYLEPFVQTSCGAGPVPASWDVFVAALRQHIDDLSRDGRFQGAVLVRRNGRDILNEARGDKSLARHELNGLGTQFELASISKLFTAVAIGRLVDAGRLSLDDMMSMHLPDYPNGPVAARVSLRHLLSHSSGIADYYVNGAIFKDKRPRTSLRDYWPLFAGDKPAFAAGTKYDYSNSNYVLLGSIIEQATGESFAAFVTREVFAAAGMSNTCYCAPGASTVAQPLSHHTALAGPQRKSEPDRWIAVPPTWHRPAAPAGYSVSTTHDLARFAEALESGKLLKAGTRNEMLKGAVPMDDGGERTLGFELYKTEGVRVVGHGGFSWGVRTQLDIYPDHHITIVILSNSETSGMEAIRHKTRRWLAHLLQTPAPSRDD